MNNNILRTLKKYTNRLLSIKTITTILILTIGLINFGYCFDLSLNQVDYLDKNSISSGQNISQGGYVLLYDMGNENSSDIYNYCVVFKNFHRSSDFSWRLIFSSSLSTNSNNVFYGTTNAYSIFCTTGWRRYFMINTSSSSNVFSFDNYWVISSDKLFLSVGDLNSCQTALNSCEISNSSCYSSLGTCGTSLNSCQNSLNSCETDLGNCMEGNIGSGDNWSALYINNIQHLGKPIINIEIPEEIERDYENEEEEMNIEIKGYGYDEEKMINMINTQNYTPTDTEMSKLISKIADFLPLLAVALLIIRARRIIKKVFRF